MRLFYKILFAHKFGNCSKFLFTTFFLIICLLHSMGQDYRLLEKEDSLINRLPNTSGLIKANLLNEITFIALRKNNFELAEKFNRQALELSRQLKYPDGIAQALYQNIRITGNTSSDIGKIKENYFEIKNICYQTKNPTIFLLKAEIGLTFGYRQIQDDKSMIIQFDSATNYFNKIDKSDRNNFTIMRDYYNEGSAVHKENRILYTYNNLLLGLKMGPYFYAGALNNHGNSFLISKKHDSAMFYLDSSIAFSKRNNIDRTYNLSTSTKGEVYASLNKPTEAICYILKALPYYDSTKATSERYFYYKLLAEQYEKIIDPIKALKYYKKYSGLKDTILDNEKMTKLSQLEKKYEIDQKQKQLELSENNLQKQKYLSSILIGGVIFIIIVAILLVFFIKRQIKANRLLDLQKSEIESQKLEVEKSKNNLNLLNDIGKKITSSNDLVKITNTVYDNINKLMDASGFGICVVNEKDNTLDFSCFLEKGKVIHGIQKIPLDSKIKVGVICVKQNIPIVINDYEKEYSKYIEKIEVKFGERPESLIYYPLSFDDKVIGAITVQSFRKNAYSEEDIELVRNIALYANIAVKNALSIQNISSQNELLENKVKERTEELNVKKQEAENIAKRIELISAIGQEITSTNNLNELNKKVYNHIKTMMDCSVFGIAMVTPDETEVIYDGSIEKEKELPYHQTNIVKEGLSTWCMQNKKEIYVNDFEKEYNKYVSTYPKAVVGEVPFSGLFYPLIFNNKSIGLITVQSFNKYAYNQEQLDFIKSISNYLTIAIQNIIALRRAEHQASLLEISQKNIIELSEIGKKITALLNVNDISTTVYKSINKLMNASVFGIGIYDKEKNTIRIEGLIEKGNKTDNFDYDLNDDNRFAVWCFKQKEIVFINDLQNEYSKYVSMFVPAKTGENVSSLIYIPLMKDKECIGVLTVQSFEKNAYKQSHIDILKNLAIYAVTAIQNAQAYHKIEEQKAEIESYSRGLETMVQQRTQQLEEKNKELDSAKNNIELLSEIGKQITSTLDIYKATRVIYSSVNNLMNASVLGIGIFNPNKNEISFRGLIEKDNYLPDFSVEVNADRLATLCYREQKEIIIKDADVELANYVTQKTALQGDKAESLIYLPLVSNDKVLGVLTVQSFNKNAYNDYHLFILRNLAVYIAITIENYNAYQQTNLAYEKLKSAQSQLVESEKMASLGQLTAGVAHEINNPINYISGGIDSLKTCFNEVSEVLELYNKADKAENSEEALTYISKAKKLKNELDFNALNDEIKTLLSSIKTGANRTTEIVKSLRTFSRLDEASLKKANIEEGIDATLVILRSQLKDRIEVIKQYDNIPEIMCYPGQLNQVFMNIISNAAQAIKGHGKIWISTKQDENSIIVSIKDNGSGMPPEVKKRIFEPFYTTKEVGEGTGLGLSIVIGIIEKHNGKIDVETEVGKGTEFIINISKTLS